MDDFQKKIFQAQTQSDGFNFSKRINSLYLMEYGIITKFLDENTVDVISASASGEQDIRITQAVLCNFASSGFTFNVKAKEGDRVLLLFPRNFDKRMFDDSEAERNYVAISNDCKGQNSYTALAFLCNYKQDEHKRYLEFDEDGKGTFKNEKVEATFDTEGNFEWKNDKTEIKIDSEGKIQVVSKGDVSLECENATVKSKKVEVTGGQVKIKGSAVANGQGAFCGIPTCIFSGTPHNSDTISGT